MPRIIRGLEDQRRRLYPDLVAELVGELREGRPFGQPLIHEQRFPETNAVRTTIIWDKWASIADDERVATILQAYEEAEGREFRDRIALAMGLTVPEAYDSGLLPIQIVTALRNTDSVTPEQCRQAMIDAGASVVSGPDHPILRFATLDEAERTVRRLTELLPDSEQVWVITQEVSRIPD
ncbi:MAG: hypothetical protein FJ276_20480 [Planctomycetes bacterium]|nr:hypothetical protein [Planctomycetota bacterium]